MTRTEITNKINSINREIFIVGQAMRNVEFNVEKGALTAADGLARRRELRAEMVPLKAARAEFRKLKASTPLASVDFNDLVDEMNR